MKKFKNLLFVALFFSVATVIGQTKISGKVVDEVNEGLPSASVVIKGTTNGTQADFDGNFTITSESTSGTLVISFVGYETQEIAFNGTTNLGTIKMVEGGNLLDEIVVVGKGIIDLATDRKTPVAVSTIRAAEIQSKLGNQEFPEILNSTPSVYATKTGGGYGDSRINVRGFNQSNTSVIINGQPVNDMENGWVYWSNWQGLSDVASGIQIQRGLGASKLAVPSVGGTVTIVTKSTDKQEGGTFASSLGNDGYFKNTISYNTGMNDKGWATSVLLGKWQGNGYVDGTEGEGYTYLISMGYKPSDEHAFNFTFTGAAQWHNQRSTRLSIRDYQNYGGSDIRKFNADWGFKDGKEYTFRRNFYNKPIATLNWDWNIKENLSLSTSIYGSWGRGGGTGARGRNFGINPFRKDLTEAIADGNLPYRNANGTINFDAVVANNQSGLPYAEGNSNYTGQLIGTNTSISPNNSINENVAIRRASMNSHDWYGAISNLKYESGNWTYGVGLDLRGYTGYHYRVLNDLLGLDGYWSTGDRNLVEGKIITETIKASPFNDSGIKANKIDYYNIGEVKWSGFNGIIEYEKEETVSAVLQVGLSNQSYKRIDHFDSPNNVESDKKSLSGGYAKGGLNYNINEEHNVFFNTGFIKRQPQFDAIFPNFSNNINPNAKNETITSFELGYGFRGENARFNINLYNTVWGDRVLTRGESDFFGPGIDGTALFEDVKQLHQGIEIEGFIAISDNLKLNSMVSIGNWRYKENAVGSVTENGNSSNSGARILYLKDAKIGDAAQFTANLNLDYSPFENFSVDVNFRHAGNLYSDFSAIDTSFDNPNNLGALKLPSFSLFDLGLSKRFNLKSGNTLGFRLNVNNFFDTEYIAEASTSTRVGDDSPSFNPSTTVGTYKGIDTRNNVWFGFGRTWNFSLRYKF